MATNFMIFCSTSSVDEVAFMVGVLGVDCAAEVGRMCTGSGLFLGWAVDFWGSSTISFPLPSSVSDSCHGRVIQNQQKLFPIFLLLP